MWGNPAAIFFIAFLHRVVPGVIAKDVMQAFGATGAIVGLLSSMYFYSYAGFMIPAGLLIDGLGARVMITAGAAVMGAGSLGCGGGRASSRRRRGRCHRHLHRRAQDQMAHRRRSSPRSPR
jgi:MFS family permease